MLDQCYRPKTSPYPRWLTDRFSWGPVDHPISWCELRDDIAIDCGTHAAIARNLLEVSGEKTVAVQLIEQYTPNTIDQWREEWGSDHDSWLGGSQAYHEVIGVVDNETLIIYDPLDGQERRPVFNGYGSISSIRVIDLYNHDVNSSLNWSGYTVPVGSWWEPE